MNDTKNPATTDDDSVDDPKQSKEVDDSTVVVLTGDDIQSGEENQYKERYLYLQADFDNYKKRMNKQTRDTVKWANEKLIRSLLPLVDDFERAVSATKQSQDIESVISGTEMLLTNFQKTLQETGVTEINTIGEQFDPRLHEAVDRVETLDHAEGTIIEELRKGYLFHDHSIRPSMVRVAVRPAEEITEENNIKEKEC